MITVLRVGGACQLVAVTHCLGLADALAVALAYPEPGSSFLVEENDVARSTYAPGSGWRLVEATGYQLIALHDALTGGKELYRLATRSVALSWLLEDLAKLHPAPEEVEELPVIYLERREKEAA